MVDPPGIFGNLVSARDVYRLCAHLPRNAGTSARRLLWSGRRRTVDTYSRPAKDDQWWSIPAVQRRWSRLVTGDPGLDHYQWIADRHLQRGGLCALSVGCGEGARELRWARTGRFRRVLGIDLSPYAIASARRAAAAAGLADVVQFEVGDLADPRVGGDAAFDVVIGEHSIHHLSPLRAVLQSLRQRLVPGGLVLVDEFVGPTKFQGTDAQLGWINRLLPQLPERLRVRQDGSTKRRDTSSTTMQRRWRGSRDWPPSRTTAWRAANCRATSRSASGAGPGERRGGAALLLTLAAPADIVARHLGPPSAAAARQ
ncbi:MAG: class I SAM-dependent methyltransferase [Planctomycetota bacterium]